MMNTYKCRTHKTPCWANPVLGGLCSANRTCLSVTPNLLGQPIIPGISRSRRSSSRRYMSVWDKAPNKYAIAQDRKRSILKGTNLNFNRWNEKVISQNAVSAERIPRYISSRSSSRRNRIFTEKQSKVIRVAQNVHNLLENNPQVRPSICTFISGFFIFFGSLAMIMTPLLYNHVPKWIGIIGAAVGVILIFGGLVGTAIRFPKSPFYIKSKRKRQRNSAKSSQIKKLQQAYENGARKDNSKSAWKISLQDKCKPYNCSMAQTTRTAQANSNNTETFFSKFAKVFSRPRKNMKEDKGKVSSNQVIDFDKDFSKVNINNNCSSEIAAVNKLSVDAIQNSTEYDDNSAQYQQIGFQNERDYHRKLLRANELFDIFHDPLLHRATTRLKFKCDCEFHEQV